MKPTEKVMVIHNTYQEEHASPLEYKCGKQKRRERRAKQRAKK